MRQCIYSIHCECGRCYIGETGRPLGIRIWEHMNNLKQGLLEKSRLAEHAYEEGHRIQWKEAKTIQIEANNIYRKYKEAALMACITNPISQPSLEFSPTWIPLICEEVGRLQGSSLYKPGSCKKFLCCVLVPASWNFFDHLSMCLPISLFCCFLLLF
jgi:predicted GIY-YIG superfamily endonuclease